MAGRKKVVGHRKEKDQPKKETVLEWFDEEIGKFIHHPLAFYFEKWANKLQERLKLTFVLALITSIFSKIQPICIQDKCYTHYIELIINPGLLFKPFSVSVLHAPFITAFAFFFVFWLVVLTLAIWIQRKKLINRLIIPVIVVCILIYVIFATSGMVRPFFLETGTFECTNEGDCVRAGYCGEVCASIYRPIYTTFSENCVPLKSCGCVNYHCAGT